MMQRTPAHPRLQLDPNPVLLLARLIIELRDVSTPTDLAELAAHGILYYDADGWWRCPSVAALPDDAAVKITAMEQDCIGWKVRFSLPRLEALCREMERLAAAWGVQVPATGPEAGAVRAWLQQATTALPPHAPPVTGPGVPPNGNGNGQGALQALPGTEIAVLCSGARSRCFWVTVTGFDRCRNCGAWIVWGRTRKNRKPIPLEPWLAGQTCTRSHFKLCHKRHTPWGWPTN
jgi:hypothetical protein